MLNGVFIYLFSALATSGAIVVSQLLGYGDEKLVKRASSQPISAAAILAIPMVTGQCVGANDYDQADYYLWKMLRIAAVYSAIFCTGMIVMGWPSGRSRQPCCSRKCSLAHVCIRGEICSGKTVLFLMYLPFGWISKSLACGWLWQPIGQRTLWELIFITEMGNGRISGWFEKEKLPRRQFGLAVPDKTGRTRSVVIDLLLTVEKQ